MTRESDDVLGDTSGTGLRWQVMELLRHARKRWYVYVPVALIWVMAYVRLCIDPTPRLPLLFNWTASLPYHVAWADYQKRPLARGDFIVFSFAGEAQDAYPGLRQQPFFKQVKGLPGDTVTVQDREVFINGLAMGVAKAHAFDRRPLEPIAPTVIPPDHYYVQGTSADSFDSRYRSSGLVRAAQVVATVVPLF